VVAYQSVYPPYPCPARHRYAFARSFEADLNNGSAPMHGPPAARTRVFIPVILAASVGILTGSAGLLAGAVGATHGQDPVRDTLRFSPVLSGQEAGTLAPPVSSWVPLQVDDRPAGSVRETEREDRRCLAVETRGEVVALGRPVGSPGGAERPDSPALLSWSWFLDDGIPDSSLDRKEADDYGARILVNFRYDPDRAGLFERLGRSVAGDQYGVEAPGSALSYVWSLPDSTGRTAWNPNTDKVATVVVAGADQHGWTDHTRDVSSDYRTIFGDPVPDIVSIVLFSDSDDTGGTTGVCFGGVRLVR